MKITTFVATILAIVAASAALVLAPAPAAHAGDPNSDFLECLNRRGAEITDVDKALALGHRIQNDEVAGVPPDQIIWESGERLGRVGGHGVRGHGLRGRDTAERISTALNDLQVMIGAP